MKVASPSSTLFICGHTLALVWYLQTELLCLLYLVQRLPTESFFYTILWPSDFLFCYVCVLNFMPLSITACRSFHFLIQFSKVFQDIKDLNIACFKLIFTNFVLSISNIRFCHHFWCFWYHYLLRELLFCFSLFFFIPPAALMQFSFFPHSPLKIFYTLKNLNH